MSSFVLRRVAVRKPRPPHPHWVLTVFLALVSFGIVCLNIHSVTDGKDDHLVPGQLIAAVGLAMQIRSNLPQLKRPYESVPAMPQYLFGGLVLILASIPVLLVAVAVNTLA